MPSGWRFLGLYEFQGGFRYFFRGIFSCCGILFGSIGGLRMLGILFRQILYVFFQKILLKSTLLLTFFIQAHFILKTLTNFVLLIFHTIKQHHNVSLRWCHFTILSDILLCNSPLSRLPCQPILYMDAFYNTLPFSLPASVPVSFLSSQEARDIQQNHFSQ